MTSSAGSFSGRNFVRAHFFSQASPLSQEMQAFRAAGLLEGSWVVISGAISRVTILISPIRGLITLLRTTHEPPSTWVSLIDPSGALDDLGAREP